MFVYQVSVYRTIGPMVLLLIYEFIVTVHVLHL